MPAPEGRANERASLIILLVPLDCKIYGRWQKCQWQIQVYRYVCSASGWLACCRVAGHSYTAEKGWGRG